MCAEKWNLGVIGHVWQQIRGGWALKGGQRARLGRVIMYMCLWVVDVLSKSVSCVAQVMSIHLE